jgi:hypothetical protein
VSCAGYLFLPEPQAGTGQRPPVVSSPTASAAPWTAWFPLEPFFIPMVGKPGESAVTATHQADRHIQTLTGGQATTRWQNQVAP